MTLSHAIRRYIRTRVALGELGPISAGCQRRSLLAFAYHIDDPPVDVLSSLHVEAWLASRRIARSTARQRFSHIRSFCRWAVRHGHMPADPTADLKAPRQPRAVPRGYRAEAVRRLLDACPDARGRLIVLLMVQEGLRAVETTRLEMGHVDFCERTALIQGKGGRERILPLSAQTWDALEEYLGMWPAAAGPLLRSYTHPRQGLSPAYVAHLVGGWLRDSGTVGGGHGLRHTMASELLRAGADIRDIQMALGHASLASTSVYLPFSDVKRLRPVMGGRWYGNRKTA